MSETNIPDAAEFILDELCNGVYDDAITLMDATRHSLINTGRATPANLDQLDALRAWFVANRPSNVGAGNVADEDESEDPYAGDLPMTGNPYPLS
jgi:hypothetical protein